MREKQIGEGRYFIDLNEILKALENGDVTLHSKINARIKNSNGDNQKVINNSRKNDFRKYFTKK